MLTFGIYACALRDNLVARAKGNDLEALQLLLHAVPATMPQAIRKAARDSGLRSMATKVRALYPAIPDHRVATILLAVGASADKHRPLDVNVIGGLSTAEIEELKMYASGMLSWLNNDRSGKRWPALRTIRRAIA